jgi:hypothetical protein
MNFLEKILQFHKKNRWLSHTIFWAAVLLVSISSSKYYDGKRGTYSFELISDGLYELPEIAAAYFLTYVVIPFFFYQKKYFTAIVAFVVSSYLICVAARIIIVKICEPLAGVLPKAFETYQEILTDIPKLLYVYFFQIFAVAFVFMCLKVLKDQLDIQKRTLTLEKEKAETELKLLKTQLNPHFLFNTLNNIYSLSFTSSSVTSESIARLADILDHILYRCDTQYVPLSAEIALIKNYIELEKLRYDKRLTINFDTSINREIVIAPLILLSLVENAFKHGASDDTGAPVIDIYLQVNERSFIFNIVNTVAEQKNDLESSSTDRIGLNNLRKQLDLIYVKDYTLDVARRNKSFEVNLTIELKHQTAVYEKNQVLIG